VTKFRQFADEDLQIDFAKHTKPNDRVAVNGWGTEAFLLTLFRNIERKYRQTGSTG
jgi:hypothetical protein